MDWFDGLSFDSRGLRDALGRVKVFTPFKHPGPMGKKAFVLINTDLGAEPALHSELKKIEGVVGVWQVFGVYDMIVEVEAESDEKMKEIVFSRIRSLEHIRSTLTLSSVS